MTRKVFIALLAVASGALAAEEPTFLTSATNVRLRAEPSMSAPVVEMLVLGTRLAGTGPEQAEGWLPVRVLGDGGLRGWINTALVVPMKEATRLDVLDRLIESRLARHGDGFGARRELLDLVERTLQSEWPAEQRGRLALQRLQALQGALGSIPWKRDLWDEPLRAWVQERSSEIRYNEPGGQWLIRPELTFAAHDASRNTAASDEIAWLAVNIGLGGECEGHLLCYLKRFDVLEVEYLRREPDGRHLEEVVAHLIDRVESFIAETTGPGRYYFDPERECAELNAGIAAMTTAVQATRASQRAVLVQRTGELLKQRCP